MTRVPSIGVSSPPLTAVRTLLAALDRTALTTLVYFITRVFHYVMHVLAIPLMRTIAFLIGFACQLIMGISILSLL